MRSSAQAIVADATASVMARWMLDRWATPINYLACRLKWHLLFRRGTAVTSVPNAVRD